MQGKSMFISPTCVCVWYKNDWTYRMYYHNSWEEPSLFNRRRPETLNYVVIIAIVMPYNI